MTYDQLERLAGRIDRAGGFVWDGSSVVIGSGATEVHLYGEQRLELMTHLWRRASQRRAEEDGISGYQRASYNQGWNDARREMLAVITGVRERHT